MLKTTRLFAKKLAVGYKRLISPGVFHWAFSVSENHDFKDCSTSTCFAQNSTNVFRENTRINKYTKFPIWEQHKVKMFL